MPVTPQHLRIIHQEVFAVVSSYRGWTMIDATNEINRNVKDDVIDYTTTARLGAHMLGTQAPDADSIEECVDQVREASHPGVSNDDILRDLAAFACADAETIDMLKSIQGLDEDIDEAHADLTRELRGIVALCLCSIAEIEYAQYMRLRERIGDSV